MAAAKKPAMKKHKMAEIKEKMKKEMPKHKKMK